MIKKLIQNKRNVFAYIIGLIVSSCNLAAGNAPFGFAALGATATLGIPILIPFIGIAIITFLKFGALALLKFAISSIAFVVLKSFFKKENPTKTSNTVKMLVASAIGESICLLLSDTLIYDSLLAIYSVVTSAVFYLVFEAGMSVLIDYSAKNVVSSEDMIATSALITIMLGIFGKASIFGISVRGTISVLTVMILGWKLGPCIGATAGITTSIVAGLMGYGSAVMIATYGFSGLLSGVLAKFGKIGAVIGFILGNAILAFYANGSTEVIISLKEIIVASVFLLVLPRSVSLIMDDLFDYDGSLSNRETKLFQKNTIYKLNAMSDAIDEMTVNETEEENPSEELRVFIKNLDENTCQKCSRHDECWNKCYHSMYETVFNMVEVLQSNGEVTEKDISEDSPCENKEMLADGLNFSYQIYKVNQNWQEKMKEQKHASQIQLKEVSNAINNIMQSATTIEAVAKKEDKYKLSIGVAKCKKDGSIISGDNYINVRLNDNKYLLGISDGMGSGELANKKSKRIISMLERLLNTGFEKKSAIELVNSVMLINNEEEVYATLDASIIDLSSGSTEFIKVSSCPTYIKHASNVGMVQSVGLPVGVLENADIDLYGKNIEKGDVIVMMTDGILDANDSYTPKELWITELLKAVKTDNPQRLADIILQEAIDSNCGAVKDDMTILVAVVE